MLLRYLFAVLSAVLRDKRFGLGALCDHSPHCGARANFSPPADRWVDYAAKRMGNFPLLASCSGLAVQERSHGRPLRHDGYSIFENVSSYLLILHRLALHGLVHDFVFGDVRFPFFG